MHGNRLSLTARLVAAFVLVAVVVVLAGCGGSSGGSGSSSTTPAAPAATSGGTSSGGGGVTVTEANFAFSPSTVSAKVGDTVTFTNNDSVTHEVKIDGKDLGQQAPGATVTWAASKAGTYPFSCIIHPQMTGTCTVK